MVVSAPALLVALVSATLAPWVGASTAARDYLDRMSHSFRELDYRGVFTYQYGSQLESLRISHAVRDGVERERLVYLNGEPRELIRDGHQVSCSHAGNDMLRLGGQLAQGPFARSLLQRDDISDHYLLALGARTRVADRSAVELLVRPVDEYRYGFYLYLDADTALLLKSLTVSPSGQVLERFQFAEIEIGANIDDSELQSAQGPTRHPEHFVIEQTGVDSGAQVELPRPQWLPPGFALSARSVRQDDPQAPRLVMYSDGFSTMTLVLEALEAGIDLPVDGKASRGATVAYMRSINHDDRPYLLTVVGEVPLETARRVARSVMIQREPT